ncbi:MAG: M13 family metallopeptidase [Rhodocyclaceae bacterium]|nr:M13 family metallopeptidase [Rhodocyclaceae bacterium]
MKITAIIFSAFVAVVPLTSLHAQTTSALRSGIDLEYIDDGVRAQDDFYRYSQGKWLAKTEIPADRAGWGSFNIAQDNVEQQLRAIIEEVAASGSKSRGSNAQKVGDFYASFMNEQQREVLRLAPLRDELANIAAAKNQRDLTKLMARYNRIGVSVPINVDIHQDNKASTNYVVDFTQSGLGLPNRDYFLKLDDARLTDIRSKYQTHLEKLLTLAGQRDAATSAAQVVAFETALAKIHWSAVENRDRIKRYNKRSLAELSASTPGFDWPGYLKASGLQGKMKFVIVSQPSYMTGFAALLKETPLPVLKAYFQTHLLAAFAPFLSQDFVAERFAFAGTVLSGTKENRTLQKRGVALVNQNLGEILGKLYVEKHFPAERKQQVETMVKHFLAAFKQGIETLDWMTPATKQKAQLKLAKMHYKIGYPDKWRDYSKLEIVAGDLIGNVIRSRQFEHQREIDKLGHPIDRDEWHMTPQTVNAYFSPELNEIVFPAARLQAPLYDASADPAINYGAVGISIGHEISHAFDDQGSKYDGDGNLNDWWTKEDREKFAAKGELLVAQYNTYSPLPGYTLNGELTLGENIADNAGAIMAMRAYRLSLGGKAAPVIDGFTAEQRLFMGLAQARRGKSREPQMISQIKSDPHSPPEFRVNGSLRNHPDFYATFDIKPGDKMYLPPEQRVVFW